MKSSELHVGLVVEITDSGGRGGKRRRLLNRKARVLEIGIPRRSYSNRADGIKVVYLIENDQGELEEQIGYDQQPMIRIVLARELISVEEADELRAENKRRQEEARIKQAQREEYEASVRAVISMHLDSEDDAVTVSAQWDEEEERWIPWRISIDRDVVDEIMLGHNGAEDRPKEGDTVQFRRQNEKQIGQIKEFFHGGKLASVEFTDDDDNPTFVIRRVEALKKVETEVEEEA